MKVLAQIAVRGLDADLRAAPESRWPEVLAGRQVAPSHVRPLASSIGLRLSRGDLDELRRIAAAALADIDLHSSPTADTAAVAGAAMRAAIADHLAVRCSKRGTRLLRRVTGGRFPDPALRDVELADWRALIHDQWMVLPVMRPADIAGIFGRRLSAGREDGPGSPPAVAGASSRPAAVAA